MTGPSVSFGSSEGNTSRTVTDTFIATGACKPSELPSSTSPCNTEKSAPEAYLWNGYLSSIRRGSPVRVTYTVRLDGCFVPVSRMANRLPEMLNRDFTMPTLGPKRETKGDEDRRLPQAFFEPLLSGCRRGCLFRRL